MKLAAIALAVLLLGRPVAAQPAKSASDAQFRLGVERFSARDFEGAITSFERSFAATGDRSALYAWAQAERMSGDCQSAIVLYERYLASGPTPRNRAAAERQLAHCRRALETRPDGAGPSLVPDALDNRPGVPEQPVAVVPAASMRVDAATPMRPWYKDGVGLTLMGAGAAFHGVGVWNFIASRNHAAASDATTYREYAESYDRGRTERIIALTSFAVGTALVAGAVVRFAMRSGPERPAIAVLVTTDGAQLISSLRF